MAHLIFMKMMRVDLLMSAKITQTSWGKDAYQMIKDGIVRSMSFGMNVIHDTWLKGADGIPLRIIDEINLLKYLLFVTSLCSFCY